MTVGIYMMEFRDGSKYIGQSNNCERRKGEHYESMLAYLHPNKKVRAKFNSYGAPVWSIICECTLEELNDAEILCIKQFNSYHGDLGLNLNRGGGVVRHKKSLNPVHEKALADAQTAITRETNKKLGKQIVIGILIGFLTIITAYICTM